MRLVSPHRVQFGTQAIDLLESALQLRLDAARGAHPDFRTADVIVHDDGRSAALGPGHALAVVVCDLYLAHHMSPMNAFGSLRAASRRASSPISSASISAKPGPR